MKKFFIPLLLLCSYGKAVAQIDSLNQRIFLIGDAGDLSGDTHPVIDWIKKHADLDNENTTVIFLGDNVYPLGMPSVGDPSYSKSKKILDYEISLVKDRKAKAFFVPGNHDWKNGKQGGWQQVENEEDYINSQGLPNVKASPTGGCPGPEEVVLSDKVVLALMDSQWWLYVHEKPGLRSTCATKTEDEILTELNEIASSHPNQLLVVAMHHPIYSHGPHGGDYSWKHHLFPLTELSPNLYIPLPVIGSIYPIMRGFFGSLQDTEHPLYRGLRSGVRKVLESHPYTIHVAGHDHGLQMLMKDSVPYIVSGAGTYLSRLQKGRYSLFADRDFGFAVLEVRKSGKAEAKFYSVQNSSGMDNPTFVSQLKTITPVTPPPSMDTLEKLPDYITAVANPKLSGNRFKNFFLGKNYRNEWTEPLKVPVLDIGTAFGGLTPTKLGGGKQTKSLRVEDKSGKEWALRSIEKYPDAALPADLRETVARDLVADGVSASYPYAALTVGELSKAAGVPYLKDSLVFIPNDPRLQRFRNAFDSMLVLMEEHKPEGIKKTDNTDEVILKIAKNNDDHIDQQKVLMARLLDNFIMDFDRHEGQWIWSTYDTGKGKVYFPIPKDRDQAFFVNQGLLPHMIKAQWIVPQLQGFKAKADNIKTFNKTQADFDRTFLNGLSKEDWQKAIDTFLLTMTDNVIEQSLKKQPAEIQKYSAAKIINTLKQRRTYFQKEMMTYYRFLAKEVNVVGSNQKEQFVITKNNDGSVALLVNKINKEGEIRSKMYDRVFNPKETKEIRIYGLNGDDKFIVKGGATPIKIRIIGGPGEDEYVNESTAGKPVIYDATFETNKVDDNGRFINKFSGDPQVNRYNRKEYKYDVVHPSISAEYNVDDGLYLGGKLELIKQGFRKDPYSMLHTFRANRALKTSSYHFRYNGEFIKALGNNDIVLNGDFRAPVNVTNFFGFGNNTVKNFDQPERIKYYRARYNIINASALVRRQLQSWMKVTYGPAFQYFVLDSADNSGKFISNTAINGLKQQGLYTAKSYLGGEVNLAIDSRNNPVLATRGFVMDAGIRSLYGLNNPNNVTQLRLNMTFYLSRATNTRGVIVTRVGVGHNIGTFEFPQAQYLSGLDNLRGYRKQRFAGRTMVYNNTEFRFKLGDFNTYLFPGSIGLQFFNDVGRVWSDGENSKRWHDGYGAGIWVSPIKRFVVTASVARSEEETALPLVTFGFLF